MFKPFRSTYLRGHRGALGSTALVALGVWGCSPDQQPLTAPSNSLGVAAEQQPADLQVALAVHRRHTMRLITLPGVVGTAVGVGADGRAVIQIFLEQAGVTGLPNHLEGVPVEVQVTGKLFSSTCTPATCTTTDVWPLPVPIGVSTGSDAPASCGATGTIGARVKAGSAVYALSNNHIYADENRVPLGTNALQPGLIDTNCSSNGSNVIGTLFAYAQLSFCGGNCPNNTIDAAIALSDATKLDNKTPPAGYGTPKSGWLPYRLGQLVKKYGRTTSLTTGQISGIDANLLISYPSGRSAEFVGQIVISNCPNSLCNSGGDSGSLWVTNDTSANPIGLLFAGNSGSQSYANPIANVLAYFGVSVDGKPSPTASGGLTAHGGPGLCTAGEITAVTASGSNVINLTDSCGHTGTMTLSGFTASGGLTAHSGHGLICTPGSITAVTGSGGNAINLTDSCTNTGTMTLSGGAIASGGLIAHGGNGLCTAGSITADTASGGSFMNLTDSCGNQDYVKLSY